MNWESDLLGWLSRRSSALSLGTTCILSRTARSPLFIVAMWIDFPRRINRTTLEDLSPFLLLRLIPNLTSPHDPFPTPEHRLSYNQRRVVKRAHRRIQLYSVGWRKNWGQVFGWERRRGWAHRLLLGGAGYVIHFQCDLVEHGSPRLRTTERVTAVRFRETHVQRTCSRNWLMTFEMQTKTCNGVYHYLDIFM